MDNLYFICWKFQSENKHKYVPFQNIYFLNGFENIVPTYNSLHKLLERAHILTLLLAPFPVDTPLHFAPLNSCSYSVG